MLIDPAFQWAFNNLKQIFISPKLAGGGDLLIPCCRGLWPNIVWPFTKRKAVKVNEDKCECRCTWGLGVVWKSAIVDFSFAGCLKVRGAEIVSANGCSWHPVHLHPRALEVWLGTQWAKSALQYVLRLHWRVQYGLQYEWAPLSTRAGQRDLARFDAGRPGSGTGTPCQPWWGGCRCAD